MSDGCTNCGRKGGCDARKHEMFAAVDAALERLYPTRRWDQRDDAAAFDAGIPAAEGHRLAELAAVRLKAATVHRPGGPAETCDYVYVLCVGRTPCLAELREDTATPAGTQALRAALAGGPLSDVYLRVALSSVAPFAAVQEVTLSAALEADGAVVLTEAPRAGVFAPPLLRRMQLLVALLAERGIRHLDFGDIAEPRDGYQPGAYREEYGGDPTIANYFFYPQPPAAIITTTLT